MTTLAFDELRYILWNGLAITEVDVDTPSIMISAGYSIGGMHTQPRIKLAFVLDHPVVEEKVRYFIKRAQKPNFGWEIALFHSLEKAHEWFDRK